MEQHLASAERQFRASAARRLRTLPLSPGRTGSGRGTYARDAKFEGSAVTASQALLRKPWDRLPTQGCAAKLGIWIFLASEVLFFGALFLGLAMARAEHGAAVLEA